MHFSINVFIAMSLGFGQDLNTRYASVSLFSGAHKSTGVVVATERNKYSFTKLSPSNKFKSLLVTII